MIKAAAGSQWDDLDFVSIDVECSGPMGDCNHCDDLPDTPDAWVWRSQRISEAVQEVVADGKTPIIYTNKFYWDKITGGNTIDFASLPLWKAADDGQPDLYFGWIPFGPWHDPTGKQYKQDTTEFGPTMIDLDVFSPSLFGLNLAKSKSLSK